VSSCVAAPESKTVPLSPRVSSEIIDTLQEKESHVASLKGLFQGEVTGEGMAFAQSFQGSILYQRPGHFRIKGFSRFGGLIFDFVLSRELYALRVQDQPKPIVGGGDNFQRLGELRLPVLLSLRAVEVLLGKLHLGSEDTISVHEVGDAYRVDILPKARNHDPSFLQQLLVEKESFHVRQLNYVNSGGETVVSIRTSDYRRVRDGSAVESNTIRLPFTVQAEDNKEGGMIELEFLEMTANEFLDDHLFTLTAF